MLQKNDVVLKTVSDPYICLKFSRAEVEYRNLKRIKEVKIELRKFMKMESAAFSLYNLEYRS